MEGGDQVNVGNGGSRWNPTKEQIDMLEGLYREGLRTPSAEQIQQITKRLQDFGHIEGKNVFYWFQNHKARQRQKQKQENTTAFYNRFFHSTPSAFPPYHHNNVVRSQSFIDIGLYKHYPKVPLPAAAAAAGCFKRRLIPEPILERRNKHPTNCTTQRYNKPTSNHDHHQETLDLFPMYPTGLLHAKNGKNDTQNLTTQSPHSSQNGGTLGDHQFYDFFCGKI